MSMARTESSKKAQLKRASPFSTHRARKRELPGRKAKQHARVFVRRARVARDEVQLSQLVKIGRQGRGVVGVHHDHFVELGDDPLGEDGAHHAGHLERQLLRRTQPVDAVRNHLRGEEGVSAG